MESIETVTPKTKEELAAAYMCSPKTISRMCKVIGIFTKKRLNTKEVKAFYDSYGLPEFEYFLNEKSRY